jgi:hypothetical protein
LLTKIESYLAEAKHEARRGGRVHVEKVRDDTRGTSQALLEENGSCAC